MPDSYRHFDAEIAQWVRAHFAPHNQILDVGAGSGKFAELLGDHFPNLDAVEIWKPYVRKYRLEERYRNVFVGDATWTKRLLFGPHLKGSGVPDRNYELVIFGDVLEHWHATDVRRVLKAWRRDTSILVAIPFLYEQGPVDSNPHEKHLQPDLTHDVFMERYPGFSCLVRDAHYGVYFRMAASHPQARTQAPTTGLPREAVTVDHEKIRSAHIAMATPVYDGKVTVPYLVSMWRTTKALDKMGIKHELLLTEGASVEKSRNILVARFMANPDYTHLLFIDADQGWETEHIMRLLAMDRDVIGVAARKKTVERLEWAVRVGTHATIERGAMRVDGIGTGFLLIRRRVIEKMMAHYSELRITTAEAVPDDDPAKPYLFTLFQTTGLSEDLTFCERWTDIGGSVWCDPESDLIHVGRYDFRGAFASAIQDAEPLEVD